jgi:UDP-hydrolysing UDP-N-acetyl-D-glucosamine 2-epimerase
MKPLLELVRDNRDLSLQLVVTGMHLLDGFGSTIQQIKKDGFIVADELEMFSGKEDKRQMSEALGKAIVGFAGIFARLKPDILLLEADRMEMLAAALASLSFHIPLVHVSGGDLSGGLDDAFRHALTRFSHFHLPNTRASAQRLKKMGEESWRIKNVGTLAVSKEVLSAVVSKDALASFIGMPLSKDFIVVLQHPVAAEAAAAAAYMRDTLQSVVSMRLPVIIVYPNCDFGCEAMIKEIETYRGNSQVSIIKNVPRPVYLGLLKYAAVLVGNSSSGIVEAPFFGTPVINIGTRQNGREQGKNVINTDYSRVAITRALKTFHRCGFKRVYGGNPYKDMDTEKKIVRVLETLKLDERLMNKRLVL